jgi:hypothetical protein
LADLPNAFAFFIVYSEETDQRSVWFSYEHEGKRPMRTDLVLWEDLDDIQARTQQALDLLQRITHAIETGRIDQPTRQDSKRLNRLLALAELMHAEIDRWSAELGLGC